jgi:uncharacterized surface protein with fasciclin (FAS1) repeats
MQSPNSRSIWIAALAVVATFAMAQAHAGKSGGAFKSCVRTQPAEFPGTIVDAAVATPELSTLKDLVVRAGLADALSAPGNLTVYAPTNDAFAKIPGDLLAAIGNDNEVLTAVLTYHVVNGSADPRRSPIPREVTTLQGQTVFLSYDKGPQVNQSNANCQGVRTSNGTVWIIDSVLLPQF